MCAWGRVGDTEKTAFFEGLGERKISREELPDILPQALFQPPSKQLRRNLGGTILTASMISRLSRG